MSFIEKKHLSDLWNNQKINDDWEKIYKLRDLFLGIVEQKRNEKELKSSMEAKVNLYLNDKIMKS